MDFRRKALLPVLALLALSAASTLTVSVAQETAGSYGVPMIADKSAAGELAFWNSIKDSSKPDDFKTYIVNFPNGMFQDPALERYEKTGGNLGDLKNLASVKVEQPASNLQTDLKPVISQPAVKTKAKAKSTGKAKSAKTATVTKKKSGKVSTRKSASKKTCKSSPNACAAVATAKHGKKKPQTGGGGGGSGGGGGWGG